MKRLRLSLALTAVLAIIAAPQPAQAARSMPGKGMIDAINYVRAKAGLRTLRTSSRLTRSSAARAELMMQEDFFAHPAQLRVPTFDRVGEILELHGGHRPRMTHVLERWRSSYGHWNVIMSSRYRWVGAARAVGLYNGARATIWVVRFGRH